MFNQVTANPKRSARLTACFLLNALIIILIPRIAFAQDKIYKINNAVIEAKVLEINKTQIKYKKFSNQNGPAYIIPVKEISMIVYENGEKEVYNQGQRTQSTSALASTNNSSVANPSLTKARSFILTENINEAIASYGKLIKADGTNPALLSEDAYALALAGIYDAALLRLDICRSIGAISPEINYFTSQVFALMGYNDLAEEFLKLMPENKAPVWISAKGPVLLQKYRSKQPVILTKTREQLIANFKRANELASEQQYFQSIAMFHDIVNTYPNEYLPYVGYSISLEKTGAIAKSAQSIEKAISLMGNSPEDQANRQFLEKRFAILKQNINLLPAYSASDMPASKIPDVARPQVMAYAGGNVSQQLTSFNGRIGYFVSGSSNAAVDVSIMKYAEYSSSNIGLSLYNRQNIFVSGAGFSLNSANGNSAFSLKLSVGISKMNRNRTTSFDAFLDMNKGLKKDALTTFNFSVGMSKYFGKRK
ncbi:MAG: hypothetical protein Q7U54_09980 [Bacteroidales bacterium]|nr:hypothetical protein [Bacteroidales bacterium]